MSFSLKKVIEGWGNLIFPSPEVEVMAKERAKTCSICIHANPEYTFRILTKELEPMEEVKGLGCEICNCPISTKVRVPLEKCPQSRWVANTKGKVITSSDLQVMKQKHFNQLADIAIIADLTGNTEAREKAFEAAVAVTEQRSRLYKNLDNFDLALPQIFIPDTLKTNHVIPEDNDIKEIAKSILSETKSINISEIYHEVTKKTFSHPERYVDLDNVIINAMQYVIGSE